MQGPLNVKFVGLPHK